MELLLLALVFACVYLGLKVLVFVLKWAILALGAVVGVVLILSAVVVLFSSPEMRLVIQYVIEGILEGFSTI